MRRPVMVLVGVFLQVLLSAMIRRAILLPVSLNLISERRPCPRALRLELSR